MKKILLLITVLVILSAALGTYNYICTMDKTVIVGYLASDHDAALFVANEKRMYEKEGITVRLVPFPAGPELIEAAESGLIDVGYCGISPVTMAIDNGAHIKIVAAVNEDGSAIVVKNDSKINNISNLKFKKVAIPQKGSVQDVLLKELLESHNISLDKVNITESEVPYMPDSLSFNKFDAFIAWEPYPSYAKIKENGSILLYSEDIWKGHPCCVIIATEKFIKDNPKNLKRFIKVHHEATNYVNYNKEEAALITAKKLSTNLNVENEGLKHVKFVSIPSDNFIKGVFKFIEDQRELNYIKKDLSNDTLFDLHYIP
ncbi:MAG: ABC transporter substrate-binding protein [Methanobacterium sp.]